MPAWSYGDTRSSQVTLRCLAAVKGGAEIDAAIGVQVRSMRAPARVAGALLILPRSCSRKAPRISGGTRSPWRSNRCASNPAKSLTPFHSLRYGRLGRQTLSLPPTPPWPRTRSMTQPVWAQRLWPRQRSVPLPARSKAYPIWSICERPYNLGEATRRSIAGSILIAWQDGEWGCVSDSWVAERPETGLGAEAQVTQKVEMHPGMVAWNHALARFALLCYTSSRCQTRSSPVLGGGSSFARGTVLGQREEPGMLMVGSSSAAKDRLCKT
jgi:hypothetical protein